MLIAENIAKKFEKDWIFRNLSAEFVYGNHYAIIGNNGSGKSTLLQCLAGYSICTKGKVSLTINGKLIEQVNHHLQISIAAPYLELIEEMTAFELLSFHQKFKPLVPQLNIKEILDIIQLSQTKKKLIKNFSSGMKQRLKLAQAIFSDCPILLLDEPTTNLDTQGTALYHQLIDDFCLQKLIIVCSNDPQEYSFCKSTLNINDFK